MFDGPIEVTERWLRRSLRRNGDGILIVVINIVSLGGALYVGHVLAGVTDRLERIEILIWISLILHVWSSRK